MKKNLPSLAFGSATAVVDTTLRQMEDKLKGLTSGVHQYDSLEQADKFRHSASVLKINGMSIGATACTAVKIKMKETDSLMFVMPFHGSGNFKIDNNTLNWSAGNNAILLSNQPLSGETTEQSSLILLIDKKRLGKTLSAMLGNSERLKKQLDTSRSHVLNVNLKNISFDTIFRQQAAFLNTFSRNPDLLETTGIDDCIYRSVALISNFKLFSEQCDEVSTNSKNGALDRVCQYIVANLNRKITLTELEDISFMSSRKLQYSFLNKFDCTPMKWIRFRRLESVQKILLNAQPGLQISHIANLCGFNNLSTFSSYYKSHFGELPSQTLLRSRG